MPTGNTQQVINYGASANDGQGDPLRTAFIKTDENFDNIWLAGPAGSNVRITNNTIGVLDTNGNLILSPNGVGVIQTNNHVIPRATKTYDLGSSSLLYRTLYANAATLQTLSVTGDFSVGGNLTVTGNIIEMGNIVTDALTIQLANTAANASSANGAGVTAGANDNIATILYNSTSNVWTTNIGLSAVGNVTAPYFIGNGSQLTGVTNYTNANAVAYGEAGWAGNIVPSGNAVYSLGNATNQWSDLYVSNATIYMNNVPISLGAGNVLTVNGEAVLSNDSNSSISTTGNITADYFFGNVSQATGLPVIPANVSAFNNDSGYITANVTGDISATGNVTAGNINSPTLNNSGNISVVADGNTWNFDNTGNLTLPSGGSIYSEGFTPSGNPGNTVVLNPHGSGSITNQKLMIYPTAGDGDHIHMATGNLYETELFLGSDNFYVKLASTGNVVINSNDDMGNSAAWTFGYDGTTVFPGDLVGSGASPAPSISGFDSISAVTLSATGNITANYLLGNGSELTNLPAPTVAQDIASVGAMSIMLYDGTIKYNNYATVEPASGNITGGNITTAGNITGNTAGFAIGYRDIPQVSFVGNATIATTDAGKHFYSTQSTNYTLTIANNASQGFQVGAAITVVNQGTGTITIAQGSGVTLYIAGNATSGNRSVATFGMATIMKVATDTWFINGTGVG